MEAVIFLSIIIALFSILVSCFAIRRVKKQIAEITDALIDVKNGNGNRRILSATNELVAPLAYEINEIVVSYESRLSTVRQTEETNRQLMTSLSHDVRTPLTTLIGYLDAAHKGIVTGKDRDDYPAERKLAIRPCRESDAHSIRWRPDPEKPLYSKTLNCQHFGNALYSIMKWNPDYTYKVRGTWASRRGEQIIVFNLPNAVPVMLIPADDGGEEAKQKKRITLCPEEWENDFGDEFYEHTVENGFYYIAPNTEWHSQARSVVAPGVEQYMGPSQEQLQMTIDDLLRGTNKIDGNKGN